MFSTTQDVALIPLDLVDGRLPHVPPDIQRQDRYMPPHRHVGGALRLRLRTLEGVPFSSLQGALSFDEDGFDGASPYALSQVLEHYLARHASVHSYTRTLLFSKQRGRIAEWPPRPGTRSVA